MTLDLKKAVMLIDKKDIVKKIDGIVTTYKHTPTNTSIEYSWEGLRKGSPTDIQVIEYDDQDRIEEIYDFSSDEIGYWEAVDKFQDIIAEKTNQTPPPPGGQCDEEEQEALVREELKKQGLCYFGSYHQIFLA